MGAIITIAFGVLLLGVPFDPGAVSWIALAVVMLLGIVSIFAIGVLLAAICLQTRQESWHYPEAVAGALFLVSGAVFPLSVLPEPVQALGLVTPLPWWIEGVRHAIFPGGTSGIGGPGSLWTSVTGTASPDPDDRRRRLLLTGALVTLAATGIFRSASAARRIAGCWTGRLAPDGGIDQRDADLRGQSRARTSRRSSAPSARSSTSAACATSCWSRRRTGSSCRAS